MTPFGWIDGVLGDLDALHISAAHRGFVYGDGVFTTFRVARGVLPRSLPLHFERLLHDAHGIGLFAPSLASDVHAAATVCAARLARTSSDAVLRVLVARAGPLGGTGPASASVIALATPHVSEKNTPVAVHFMRRTSWSPRKSLSYAPSLDAIAYARSAGGDTAVWLDADGALCEGATASVFLVKGGVLYTPPLTLGIVPGTTRAIVLALAREIGIPVRQRILFPVDAYRADEAFLTSSVRGVAKIGSFDGHVGALSNAAPVASRVSASVAEWFDAKLEVELPSVFR